jgi:hypothetical protein
MARESRQGHVGTHPCPPLFWRFEVMSGSSSRIASHVDRPDEVVKDKDGFA